MDGACTLLKSIYGVGLDLTCIKKRLRVVEDCTTHKDQPRRRREDDKPRHP